MVGLPGRYKTVRKREIVLAVAIGAVAAGGAAAILSSIDEHPAEAVALEQGREYRVDPFTEIAAVGPEDIDVTIGDNFSVTADGSADALDRFEVVVDGTVLRIQPRGNRNWMNWGGFDSPTYHVTVPRLAAAYLTGSGDMTIDSAAGEHFEGHLAGSGSMLLNDVQVAQAEFFLVGSGDIQATGHVDRATVNIQGSGDFTSPGLTSRTVSVLLTGSGDVALEASSEANVTVIGSGDVAIEGTPTCSVTRRGSGSVRCNGES